MRKILAWFTLVCVLLSAVAFAVSAQEFSDMPDNWATAALERAVKDGLINGYGGMIMPNESLTRAQMAAIFVRAFGVDGKADISAFEDMNSDAWYYADMEKAVHAGWFKGDGTKLNPDAPITREEAFTVIARAFYLKNGDAQMLEPYTDASSVSDWAVPYVTALLNKGLVAGSNGNVNPKNNISRAEFAVVMDRAVAAYVTTEGECQLDLKGHKGAVIIKANNVVFKEAVVEGDLIISSLVDAKTVNLAKLDCKGVVHYNSSQVEKEEEKPSNAGGGGGGGGDNNGSADVDGPNDNESEENPDEPYYNMGDEDIEDGGKMDDADDL